MEQNCINKQLYEVKSLLRMRYSFGDQNMEPEASLWWLLEQHVVGPYSEPHSLARFEEYTPRGVAKVFLDKMMCRLVNS